MTRETKDYKIHIYMTTSITNDMCDYDSVDTDVKNALERFINGDYGKAKEQKEGKVLGIYNTVYDDVYIETDFSKVKGENEYETLIMYEGEHK